MAKQQDNRFGVKAIRYWYNSDDTKEIACDGIGLPLIFDTKLQAVAWIESADQTVYETEHNEYSRPEYKAVRVCSAWYRGELGRMKQYQPFAGQTT